MKMAAHRGRRKNGLLSTLFLAVVSGHPLCYVDDRPTDYDEVLTFCPAAQDGACCTDIEEAEVEARFNAVGTLTEDCASYYIQVECGQCHSYSAHLYELLGAELGLPDGMTMKSEFCEELVAACTGQIPFPDYDGVDYCTKHVGGDSDLFWSYPYTEPDIFDPGLNEVFPALSNTADFPSQTISMHQSPDGTQYWLGGQAGEIKSVAASDLTAATTVMDISGGDFYLQYEEGLIDFAFGPMFSETGFPSNFYVSYSIRLDADGDVSRNRLSKFEYFEGDPTATRASEEILITTIPKATAIHSAGWCGFKPSDYGSSATSHELYWSTGDGGPQTDPLNVGQDTSNLLGSMIRIAVPTDGVGYTIPDGNVVGGLPEICATGFRNPFRCGFDRLTDDLYCGDVGHTLVEEVDVVECGNNYGWSRFEGSRCQVAQIERDGTCVGADRTGFTFPYFEYCHPGYLDDAAGEEALRGGVDICGDKRLTGNAVIGGHVYRGNYFADLIYGAYVFGDAQTRNIYYIMEDDGEMVSGTIISDGSVAIISFSEDADGELILITVDYNIYYMPCGDLCVTTCLPQAEEQPTVEALGCFTDAAGDRALSTAGPDCDVGEQAMNAAICASYCSTLGGQAFAGVEFGNQCYCGAATEDYSRLGTSDGCNMMCTGFPNEMCGGNLAINVYEIGTPAPAPVTSATAAPVVVVGDTPAPAVGATPAPVISATAAPAVVIGATPAPVASTTVAPVVVIGATPAPVVVVGPTPAPVVVVGDTPSPVVIVGPTPAPIVGAVPTPSPISTPAPTSSPGIGLSPAPVVGIVPTPAPGSVLDPSFLGCYADTPTVRIMLSTTKTSAEDMTTEVCSGLCSAFPFYGTQWGIECWCGNAATDYDQFGEGTCDFACGGDPSETCGGFYSVSVYENSAR